MSHLDDLLSAYVDGELTPGEEQRVRAHLDTCPECRRELQFIGEGRSLVRGLPPVDPPFGFYERLLRPQRRWARAAVGALAAGAAASVALMAGAAPHEPRVRPNVAQLVDAHTASASTSGDPLSGITPAAVPVSFRR
ncbi:MAG: zf-HC2 domain-containing protein [Acidimicrobiia bacterium]|nr:zf-HC2 domain-containing protein [Acidimicrobiia bacterium]